MRVDRDAVVAALRAEDVAAHLGITGSWRGRWLRSTRCATADHSSDAFGLARDGFWHCWACDRGGDLLALVAAGANIDPRADFPRVLELAAAIAGVDGEETFGGEIERPPPRPRPALPPIAPLSDRIGVAKRRAAWVWDRLIGPLENYRVGNLYLRQRGLDPAIIRRREELRETPMRCTREEMDRAPELAQLSRNFAVAALAIPVRAVADGRLVDIRVRRYEPREGEPKILGMLGSVTVGPAEPGRNRTLVGCYGHPEQVDADTVVIVEGAFDYLTALQCFPDAAVLGAVEAGSLALVAGHAARQLGARDQKSRVLIVEQSDPPRTLRDGRVVPGAADASVNEDPNAATKVVVRILGPRRIGWLPCQGEGIKDLNDLVRAGRSPHELVRWFVESD